MKHWLRILLPLLVNHSYNSTSQLLQELFWEPNDYPEFLKITHVRKLIFTLIFLAGGALYCQVSLLDAADSSAVPWAKIGYRPAKSEADFTFTLTDQEGIFSPICEEKKEECLVEITINALGFEHMHDTLDLKLNNVIYIHRNTTLDPVCVTTQYQPTTLSTAVQKITVINSDQIRKSGAVSLADVITYQTGIRLSQDNILGTSMSLGGIGGENIKVLIDGVPVIGRLNGSIDLSQINLDNIERIELIEGPLSVNYGTNALAGTLNLITKKEKKPGLRIELNPYYENIGNYNFNTRIALSLKKNTFTLSGGRNYFDGWKENEIFFSFPQQTLADTNRIFTWKPKEQYFGEVQYQTNRKGWNFNPYVRLFHEAILNRGFPKAPYFETAFDDYYLTKRADAGLIVSKNFSSGKLSVQTSGNYFQRIKNTYLKDLTTLYQNLSESPGSQDTSQFTLLNLRPVYNSTRKGKFNYELGLDLIQESAYGLRILNKSQTMGDFAVFGTCEWKPFQKFVIKPGLRYAYNTLYQAPVIPSVHLRYILNKWSLRASVARGFRAPSLKELYFDFVDINHNIQGNTDLQAEQSINYNLTLGWITQSSKNLLLKIDVSGFYNIIDNLINLGLSHENTYTYINIGHFRTTGITTTCALRNKSFSVQINGSYIGRFNQLPEEIKTQTFSFSPEISSQCSYNFWKERMNINLFYKYNGALLTYSINENDELNTSSQSAYHILDASIGMKLAKQNLLVTLGAKNLLNVTSLNVSGTSAGVHSSSSSMNIARGRSFFIGINYRLNFSFKNHES